MRRGVQSMVLLAAMLGAVRANAQTSVSIDLGTTNVENGLTNPSVGDGRTTAVTMGGVDCRRNLVGTTDYYMYFNVSDSWAYQGNQQRVNITISYYDSGTTSLELNYDAMSQAYKSGGAVTLTNTNTWKQHTYQVSDAYFGNRENSGSDFRISGCCTGVLFYLDVVQVAVPSGPAAPVIATVPSPDPATVGTAYTKQLTLIQGDPAPTWSLLQGPPGAQVGSTGLVSGWTPGPCDLGSLFTFQVRAENYLGANTATWQASVQPTAPPQRLVLNDPLDGSTIGTRSGGIFEPGGGWKVLNNMDCIYWHISPTVTHGRYEYDVKGQNNGTVGCCYGGEYAGQPFLVNELSHMYDWTFENADTNYTGYRNNPYKHAVKRMSYAPGPTMKLLWALTGLGGEDWSGYGLNWDPDTTYRIAVEWVPNAAGTECDYTTYRDGQQVHSMQIAKIYSPTGLSFRIGSGGRTEECAYIGAVYSNVKFWDLSIPQTAPPVVENVTPDPDVAWFDHPYTRQLVATQGAPAPGWCLIQGPPGAQIDAVSGLVSGWIPSHAQIGQHVTLSVKAVNASGAATETWQVFVKAKGDLDHDGDCDQDDFGIFQVCLSGTANLPPPGCDDANFNNYRDVDELDLNVFRQCFSGPNVPVSGHCAD